MPPDYTLKECLFHYPSGSRSSSVPEVPQIHLLPHSPRRKAVCLSVSQSAAAAAAGVEEEEKEEATSHEPAAASETEGTLTQERPWNAPGRAFSTLKACLNNPAA